MNKAKKIFYLLIAANVVLVGVVGATFVYADGFAKKKSSAISVLKADIDTNAQSVKSYQQLEKAIKDSAEIEKIAQAVLPQDKEQSVALAEINKLATESGLSLDQVTFDNGTSKGGAPTLTSPSSLKGVLVLSGNWRYKNGQYEQVITFLKKIEDNRRRMQITSLALTPDPKDGNIISTADIKIDIYLKP